MNIFHDLTSLNIGVLIDAQEEVRRQAGIDHLNTAEWAVFCTRKGRMSVAF